MRVRRRGRAPIAAALLALATVQPASAAIEAQRNFLALHLNGEDSGRIATVYRRGDRLWVAREDLAALRVRLDEVPATDIDGLPHAELAAVPGLQYRLQAEQLQLDLDCRGDCLQVTTLGATAPPPQSEEAGFGAFLNYGLAYQHAGTDAWAASGELGLFDGFGVISNSALARRRRDGRDELLRLDSSWLYDWPEQRLRGRLGDAITHPGAWGVPLRYAGVQLATDNSLQPYFLPFPTPDFAGLATVPSVVDVYVNNVRRLSTEVEPGPFAVRQLPVMSGAGELTVVTRDALGREQSITAPYYVSPALLRPGLVDFAVEAGALRRGYGLRSNDYDTAFVAGQLRRGLSPQLTGELRSELAEDLAAAGVAGVVVLPSLGQLSGSTAFSHHADVGDGRYASLALERIARRWNAGLRVEASSDGFRRLGNDVLAEAPRRGSLARVGFGGGPWGYVGLAWTQREFREADRDFEAVLGHYSLPLARRASLSVFATLTRQPQHDEFVGVSLSYSFAPRGSGFALVARQADELNSQLSYHEIAPLAGGLGYRARLSQGLVDQADAGITWERQAFVASADVAQSAHGSALRGELRGALSWFAHDWYTSRPIADGFAVVDTRGVPDVPVLQDHLEVGRTDARGRLFIRNLRAYQRNRLAIDPSALPLEVRVGSTEATVTPRYRNAVQVNFDLRPQAGSLLQLLQDDGRPVAAGSAVTLDGQPLELPVSLDGWLFLDAAPAGSRLVVQGPEGRCQSVIPAELAAEPDGLPPPLRCTRAATE